MVGGSGTGDSFKLTLFFGSGGGSNLVGGSGTGDSFKLTLFFGSGCGSNLVGGSGTVQVIPSNLPYFLVVGVEAIW